MHKQFEPDLEGWYPAISRQTRRFSLILRYPLANKLRLPRSIKGFHHLEAYLLGCISSILDTLVTYIFVGFIPGSIHTSSFIPSFYPRFSTCETFIRDEMVEMLPDEGPVFENL